MHPADFSIVIPSFNQAKFIGRTLESLLVQEGVGVEVLVQDGGSSDGTVEILKGYGDRIRWASESDRGQAHAINKGMELVSGKWLAYLNSDDVLLPGALEKVKREFLSHPEADFIYGQARRIDGEDRPLADYPVCPWNADLMKDTCFISQPACFWRREVREKLGGFDEDLRFSMDYDFWLRGIGAGLTFLFLPAFLAAARIHGDAKTMHQRGKSFEESFATIRRHCPGYISRRWILALAQVRAESHLQGALNNPLAWGKFGMAYMRSARELAREYKFEEPLNLASTLIPKCLNSRKRLTFR